MCFEVLYVFQFSGVTVSIWGRGAHSSCLGTLLLGQGSGFASFAWLLTEPGFSGFAQIQQTILLIDSSA